MNEWIQPLSLFAQVDKLHNFTGDKLFYENKFLK